MIENRPKTRSMTVRVRGFPRWKIKAKVVCEPDWMFRSARQHIEFALEALMSYEYMRRTKDDYFKSQEKTYPYFSSSDAAREYNESMNLHANQFCRYYEDITTGHITVFDNDPRVRLTSVSIVTDTGKSWDIDTEFVYNEIKLRLIE